MSTSPPFELPEGYTLIQYCGRGAYGFTFLVSDLLGRRLVLKMILRNDDNKDNGKGDALLRELNGVKTYCASKIIHENLIQILHSGETKDYFYYTMPAADNLKDGEDEYLPASLGNILLSRRIDTNDVFDIALALLKGIAELHKHKIAHRDIKPDNILFFNGKPCLSDIGLVSQAGGRNSLVGTYGFLPPELLSGKHTFESYLLCYDYYALGKVIYCMLTGLSVDNFPLQRNDCTYGKRTQKLFRLLDKICERTPSWRMDDGNKIREKLEELQKLPETPNKISSIWCKIACGCVIAGAVIAVGTLFYCKASKTSHTPPPQPVSAPAPAKESTPVKAQTQISPVPLQETVADDALLAQLERAIRQNDTQLLTRLLDSGLSPNIQMRQGKARPLHLAIATNADLAIIRLLVERGARLNQPDSYDLLPLGVAIAAKASEQVLGYLIEQTQDLNAEVNLQRKLTPLMLALDNRNFAAFQLLLRRGAAPDTIGEFGRTPLFKAVSHNYPKEVEALLKAGANPRITDKYQTTPLHHLPDNAEIAGMLLNRGVDQNARNRDGDTPLLSSVRRSVNASVIQRLLQSGASANAADVRGLTPLQEAVASGNAELVELLLRHGADPAQADRRGFNSFYTAVIYRRFTILKTLMKQKRDLRFKDSAGRTLLHWAAIRNQAETARLLRNTNVDIAVADRNGRTAADWAFLLGHAEVLQELAPERQNELNVSSPPPFLADQPRYGDADILLKLLNKPSANVREIDAAVRQCPDLDRMPDGESWLCTALDRNHHHLFSALLQHGADPNKKSINERFPLLEAIRRNRPQAVKLLLQYGANPAVVSRHDDLFTLEQALRIRSVLIVELLLAGYGDAEETKQRLIARCESSGNTDGLVLLKSTKISTPCCREEVLRALLWNGNTAGVHLYLSQGNRSANCPLLPWDYPLPYTLRCRPQYAMMKNLLDAGAQTELPGENGVTPLHMALSLGDLRLIRLLLEYGADPYAVHPATRENVLSLARKNSEPQLERLLEFYAPPQ